MTIKRVTFLQELLDYLGLGGRLHLEWISSAEAHKFVRVVTDFTEKIRTMGPSPISSLDYPERTSGKCSPAGETPRKESMDTEVFLKEEWRTRRANRRGSKGKGQRVA